jgi:hypothetical protein
VVDKLFDIIHVSAFTFEYATFDPNAFNMYKFENAPLEDLSALIPAFEASKVLIYAFDNVTFDAFKNAISEFDNDEFDAFKALIYAFDAFKNVISAFDNDTFDAFKALIYAFDNDTFEAFKTTNSTFDPLIKLAFKLDANILLIIAFKKYPLSIHMFDE